MFYGSITLSCKNIRVYNNHSYQRRHFILLSAKIHVCWRYVRLYTLKMQANVNSIKIPCDTPIHPTESAGPENADQRNISRRFYITVSVINVWLFYYLPCSGEYYQCTLVKSVKWSHITSCYLLCILYSVHCVCLLKMFVCIFNFLLLLVVNKDVQMFKMQDMENDGSNRKAWRTGKCGTGDGL